MIEIENLLQENSTHLSEPVDYQLGDRSWFNEQNDHDLQDIPLFLVDHFIQADLTYMQNGTFTPEYEITILILDEHEQDQPGGFDLFEDPGLDLDRNIIVKRMRLLAREFIAALTSDSRLGGFTKNIRGKVVSIYNVFDSNLDGIMLTLSLKNKEDTICIPRHNGPNP